MKKKILWAIIFMQSVILFDANAQVYKRPSSTDTVRNMIDSILQARYRLDSFNVFAEIGDTNMPEGWFSLLRIDTTKGVLFWGNSYIYKARYKYLTNYYFFNDKLVATQTSKMLIKNQGSNKLDKWERNCTYWNDSLIYSFTTDNEHFEYKQEISTAAEIIKRFKFLYSNKKLLFQKGSNTGHFR